MNHALILAAGKGTRMKGHADKLLREIAGKPLIYYTIMSLHDHPDIHTITIAVRPENKRQIAHIIKTYHFHKVRALIQGGETRQHSFEKGLAKLGKTARISDIILVHNGANPLPSQDEITRTIALAQEHGACITGHPLTATIKEVHRAQIRRTHDRARLFAAETPQAASLATFKKALSHAKKHALTATDEASLLEAIDQKIICTRASDTNFKITTPADLERLRVILGEAPQEFLVGLGQDSHIFDTKGMLTLAGIPLKDLPKLKANSDGDVIIHAICNALSQALGQSSLGTFADPLCEQGVTDSREYLKPLLRTLKRKKYRIHNLGLMLECARPKIDPLAGTLKKSLAHILDLPPARIGITATTGEKATAFGKGQGIQCFAIISIRK